MSEWFVYMLRCSDETFYTGITTDIERRIKEHNGLKSGAAYTRARRPVKLIYKENFLSRSDAARREYEVRKLSRSQKEALFITGH